MLWYHKPLCVLCSVSPLLRTRGSNGPNDRSFLQISLPSCHMVPTISTRAEQKKKKKKTRALADTAAMMYPHYYCLYSCTHNGRVGNNLNVVRRARAAAACSAIVRHERCEYSHTRKQLSFPLKKICCTRTACDYDIIILPAVQPDTWLKPQRSRVLLHVRRAALTYFPR